MQMMNTTSLSSAMDTIVAAADQAKPQIFSIAYKFNMNFEDLYQDTVVKMLADYENVLATAYNLKGYAANTARLIALHNRNQSCNHSPLVVESLDAPLAGDGLTLLDMLDDTSEPQTDTSSTNYHTKIVHRALHRLNIDEQRYVQNVYGMNGFRPYGKLGKDSREKDAVRFRVYRKLRRDKELMSDYLGGGIAQ